MTGDLIRIEKFNGLEVRFVLKEGDLPRIPLSDIAHALGQTDTSGLRKLFHRHEATLGRYSCRDILSHETGAKEHVCLSEKGVIGLLLKIKPGAAKDPAIQEKIIDFQVWAIETLSRIVSGETVPVKCEAIEDLIRSHLQIADAMSQYAHVDRGIAVSVALEKVQHDTGADLAWVKGLVRRERQGPPVYLTPTQIGVELGGLRPNSVNRMLQQLGYQEFIGSRWTPTKVGEAYAENVPFTVTLRNGGQHSDYQLKWSPDIVRILRDHLNGISQALQALPAHG